jgi:hypothetical protein
MTSTLKVTEPESAYVETPFRIKNNPHSFGKWKNPFIDTLARANGCKVQVVKPKRTADNNAIVFGRAENAHKAIREFEGSATAAWTECCVRMKLDNVLTSDEPYSVAFYAKFLEGLREELSVKIAAHANEVDEVAREFPQSNAAYPVHTKLIEIDARSAEAAREAGRAYAYKIR